MSDLPGTLDLDLWLDKSIIKRQNRLKTIFTEVFENVGNDVPNEKLMDFFPSSKGKKISKGNDLVGFPYLVLDLVRDFDLENGFNIRLLNWFGHGIFIAVFTGKNIIFQPSEFLNLGYRLGLTPSPWEFSKLILEKKTTVDQGLIGSRKENFHLWIKELPPITEKTHLEDALVVQIKKILSVSFQTREA